VKPKHLRFYILDGHDVVECDDLLVWGEWMQTAKRHVGVEEHGDVCVSTVFLGLDQSFSFLFSEDDDQPPLIFETMVFGGSYDGAQQRYYTWQEAEVGHALWIAKVFPPVEYVH